MLGADTTGVAVYGTGSLTGVVSRVRCWTTVGAIGAVTAVTAGLTARETGNVDATAGSGDGLPCDSRGPSIVRRSRSAGTSWRSDVDFACAAGATGAATGASLCKGCWLSVERSLCWMAAMATGR
jgi:hypothetical protein